MFNVGDRVRCKAGKGMEDTSHWGKVGVVDAVTKGEDGWAEGVRSNTLKINWDGQDYVSDGWYWWRFELVSDVLPVRETITKIKQGDTVRILSWSGNFPAIKDVEVGMVGKVVLVGVGECVVDYANRRNVDTSFNDLEVLE